MTSIDKQNGLNKLSGDTAGQQLTSTTQKSAKKTNSVFTQKIYVQNGETPESLAKEFGVSKEQIISQNKDKWNGKWFKVGQELTLPTEIDSNDERLKNRAKSKEEAEAGWINFKNGGNKPKPTAQQPAQSVQTPKPNPDNTGLHAGAMLGAAIGKPSNEPKTQPAKQAAGQTEKSDTTGVKNTPKDSISTSQKPSETFIGMRDAAMLGAAIGRAASKEAKADTATAKPKTSPAEPAKSPQGKTTPELPTEQPSSKGTDNDNTISKKKQDDLKDQHGGIDTKRTNRNNKAQGDIVYHNDGSVTISNRVDKRIQEMAQNLKCTPDDLKGLLFKESRFEINGKSTAAGLNQMTNDGLAGLNRKYGTNFSKRDIRRMDVMQQLDIAEASLMLSKEEKFGKDRQVNAGELFALNLYPAGAKRSAVITSANGSAYRSNKGLDKNKDGVISMNELQREILNNARHVHSDLT